MLPTGPLTQAVMATREKKKKGATHHLLDLIRKLEEKTEITVAEVRGRVISTPRTTRSVANSRRGAGDESQSDSRISAWRKVPRDRGRSHKKWANTSANMENLPAKYEKAPQLKFCGFSPGSAERGTAAWGMINCVSVWDSTLSPSNHSSWPRLCSPVIHFHLSSATALMRLPTSH